MFKIVVLRIIRDNDDPLFLFNHVTAMDWMTKHRPDAVSISCVPGLVTLQFDSVVNKLHNFTQTWTDNTETMELCGNLTIPLTITDLENL